MNRPTLPATITLLNRSGIVKRKGQGWLIRCPAHDDKDPSLSVDERDGKLLVDCFRGCKADAIMRAVGLSLSDLFAQNTESRGEPRETVYTIAPSVEHVRQDYPDGSKKFFWRRDGKVGLQGLKTADLPLYGMARIGRETAEGAGQIIILSEGEKASDALWERGWCALATVTGAAGAPSKEVLRALQGDKPEGLGVIYLWPDADEPGYSHMERVARNMPEGLGTLVIRVPLALEGDDAADYTGDIGDLIIHAELWTPGRLWNQGEPSRQEGFQGWIIPS